MKKLLCGAACALCAALLALAAFLCLRPPQKKEPTRITLWTYYNADQLAALQRTVQHFNRTLGAREGVLLEAVSYGSVSDLVTNLQAAAEGRAGAPPMPDLFSVYPGAASALDAQGLLVDLAPYFSAEERAQFIPAYLAEGELDDSGRLLLLPTAKATELLFVNETDWLPFAVDTGAAYTDMQTMEGLVDTARRYYEWTDAQTDTPWDGRALFGRDALSNYLLAGARELGSPLFTVENGEVTITPDRQTLYRLWQNFYLPFVQGWFDAVGRFRSDDVKTGSILAYVGSNTSAVYFPQRVITGDTESHEIKMKVLPPPHFAGCAPVAVQQGAGVAVARGEAQQVEASVLFLKWFSEAENDLEFAAGTGYLPVTKAAASMKALQASGLLDNGRIQSSLSMALKVVQQRTLYFAPAFASSDKVRMVLEQSLLDRAEKDRAVVEQRLAAGWDLAQATEQFVTEESFDRWYQALCTQLRWAADRAE